VLEVLAAYERACGMGITYEVVAGAGETFRVLGDPTLPPPSWAGGRNSASTRCAGTAGRSRAKIRTAILTEKSSGNRFSDEKKTSACGPRTAMPPGIEFPEALY
jgi:hypothetical protein